MKKLRWVLLIVLIMAAGAALALHKFRSFGHQELVAYVAELRANGERVTFQELAPLLSPHTNNSFGELTNLLAKLGPPPTEVGNLRLGLSFEPGRARPIWRSDVPWLAATNGEPDGSWRELSRILAKASPHFLQLRKNLEHPAPNSGPLTNWYERKIAWQEARAASSWLACAALADMHDERCDDALNTIRAMSQTC